VQVGDRFFGLVIAKYRAFFISRKSEPARCRAFDSAGDIIRANAALDQQFSQFAAGIFSIASMAYRRRVVELAGRIKVVVALM
jgi:hypothetical protein